ncbi:hypothetical protein OEZ85_007434 [Tetradesmus obliquus]|uniref:MalT-like TPR region domain-containing protein n=1 Tax=Tetradesmus obliquus TaxID=3088 RepID=A0ABY8TG43_TETOB|nr:hypothetical protein OEZ85_007434 [Tetradesmus obliquus]
MAEVLGSLYREDGQYRKAEPFFRRALSSTKARTGESSAATAACLGELGSLLQELGDWDGAADCFRDALDIMKAQQPPDQRGKATALSNRASLLQAHGNPAAAKQRYLEAIRILESCGCTEQAMEARSKLVEEQRSLASMQQAEECYRQVLELVAQVKGPLHPDTAAALNELALVQQQQIAQQAGTNDEENAERLAEAASLYQRALAIREEQLGPLHPDTGTTYKNLASLLQMQGDLDAAAPLYQKALLIAQKQSGQHPDTATALSNLAVLLQERGELQAAERLQRRALAISGV